MFYKNQLAFTCVFIEVQYINIPIDISKSRGMLNTHSYTLNCKVQIL